MSASGDPLNPTITADRHWMLHAIRLSRRCPPVPGRPAVGAVIVDSSGNIIAGGHSRDSGDASHAEQSALAKIPGRDGRLAAATLYSTVEPCSRRKPRTDAASPPSCTQLILDAGIRRVVIAWRPPALCYPDSHGYEILTAAGVTVLLLPELAHHGSPVVIDTSTSPPPSGGAGRSVDN